MLGAQVLPKKMLGAEEDLLGSGDPPAIQFNSIKKKCIPQGAILLGSWWAREIMKT